MLLPLLAAAPQDRMLLDLAATCYWNLDATDAGLQLMRIVADTGPKDAAAWGRLGAMCLAAGDRDGAIQAFETLLSLRPRNVPALASLNRLRPFAPDSARARTLRDLARAKKTQASDRTLALNAIGRIEAASGNHHRAFRAFRQAKALAPPPYPAAAIDAHVDGQIATFDPARWPAPHRAPDSAEPRLFFIVGLPRSGTTLVEAILSRHPKVRSIGEHPVLQDLLADLRRAAVRRTGTLPPDQTSWDWFRALTPDDLARHRTAFYARARIALPAPDRIVVNKLPLNLFDLGFAHCLLPEARFVFMLRHPLDTGLSCLSTHFGSPQAFSYSLDRIAHMTLAAHRSLDDYATKLGPMLRQQSYRALVEDPEPQIRALVAHAGLDWDPACLTPEDAAGAVRTASALQVREQINRRGLDTWRSHVDDLSPLVSALGGSDWLTGWEARDKQATEAGPP
ncbi:sulfotransferase family protein [Chachezhania sediminis]|uniref:sulfotransferase family protein n=1 Tax=Chachezhania sediminis TaxID=2599291 RepID=UPI001E5C576B|nr:sulfotransferase [Chachezhania sediminis]